jgi:hypothetical protein
MTYRRSNTVYEITVLRHDGERMIELDGVMVSSGSIQFDDSGETHRVTVSIPMAEPGKMKALSAGVSRGVEHSVAGD